MATKLIQGAAGLRENIEQGKARFVSDIGVRLAESGPYRGLWLVERVSTGERITDCTTEEQAEKAAQAARRYSRERRAAETAHDAAIRTGRF